MIEINEKKQEKDNPKIFGTKKIEIRRDSVKKSTISLSEEPNIIFDNTQFYDIIKSNKNHKLETNQNDDEYFYPNKFKNSFINEPISHNKDESRSNLSEIQMIVKTAADNSNNNTNNNHTNKSIGKKEKKKIIHSKRKNSVETIKNKKNKEMDKEGDELKINNDRIKKHHHSSKKKSINYLDDEQKEKEKEKGKIKIKFRKSDIIRPFKKDSMLVGDANRKNKKRKSLFSHNGHGPDKQYTNEIF